MVLGRKLALKAAETIFRQPWTQSQPRTMSRTLQTTVRQFVNPRTGSRTQLPFRCRHKRRTFCSHNGESVSDKVRAVIVRHSNAIGLGGFCLLTIQWCMEDVLLLRCTAITCCGAMIVFNYFRNPPTMLAVRFNLLFMAINGYFISKLLLERRDLDLDPVEQQLWESTFDGYLSKVQMRVLLDAGCRRSVPNGEVFREAGKPKDQRLAVLVQGQAQVQNKAGELMAELHPGDFLGEFGSSGQPTDPTTLIVEWNVDQVRAHLDANPAVRHSLEAILMYKLKSKLASMNETQTFRAYVNILRGVMADGVLAKEEKDFIDHFKKSREISSEQHRCALLELGYTLAEFEAYWASPSPLLVTGDDTVAHSMWQKIKLKLRF